MHCRTTVKTPVKTKEMERDKKILIWAIVIISYYGMFGALFCYNLGKYDTFSATMSGFWDSIVGFLPIMAVLAAIGSGSFSKKGKNKTE